MKHLVTMILLLSSLTTYCKDDFNSIYKNTLKYEGTKYVKNKIEESKYGITNYYSKDVKNLTKGKAYKIAYNKIYKTHRINEIKDKDVKTFVFDWLYHSSPTKAIKNIQRTLGIEVDGVIGTETIKAINSYKGNLVKELKQTRLQYVRGLKHYKKYKTNWEDRINNIV